MYDTPPLNQDPLRLSLITNHSNNKKKKLRVLVQKHTQATTPAPSIYGTPLAEITPTNSSYDSKSSSVMFHTPLSREDQLELWREKRRKVQQQSAPKANTNSTTDSKNNNKQPSRTTPAPSSSLGRPPSHRPSPRVAATGTSTASSGNRGTRTPSPSFLLKRPSSAASLQSRSFSSRDYEDTSRRPNNSVAVATTIHSRAPMSSSSRHKPLAAVTTTTTTPTFSAASSSGRQQRRYSSLLSRAPLSQRCPNDRSLLSQPAVRIPKLATSHYDNKTKESDQQLSSKNSVETLDDDDDDDDPINENNDTFDLEHVVFRRCRKLLDDSLLSALSNSFSDNDDDDGESTTIMRHDPIDGNDIDNNQYNIQGETIDDVKQDNHDDVSGKKVRTWSPANETSDAVKVRAQENGQEPPQQQQQKRLHKRKDDMPLLEPALETFEANADFDWRKEQDDDLSPVAPATRTNVWELSPTTLTTERRAHNNLVAKKSPPPAATELMRKRSDPFKLGSHKEEKDDNDVLDRCKKEDDVDIELRAVASTACADVFRDENDELDWRKDMDDDEDSPLISSSRRSSCLISRRTSRKRREALEVLLPIPSPMEPDSSTTPPLPSSSSLSSQNAKNTENDSPLETPTFSEQDDSSAFDWRNCKSTPSEAKKQERRRTDSATLLLPIPSLHSGDSGSILTPSPIPTPKLGDASIASRTPASVGSNDHKEAQKDSMLSSPNKSSEECKEVVSPQDQERTVHSNSDMTASSNKPLGPPVVKVNEKTLLCPIPESTAGGQDPVEQIRQLQNQVDALMVEKKNMGDKLYSIRKSYEERVTPFRDLFDEQRKLRQENKRLVIEKKQVESAITALQTQMMSAVNTAVQKAKTLQAELEEERRQHAEAKQRNAELERELVFSKEKCS